MKTQLKLVNAPIGMQPGGYVPRAYADRTEPTTPAADVEVTREGKAWRVTLGWDCPNPVRDISDDTNQFVDAAALLAPVVADAPWVTMGAEGKAVEAILWRADREAPLRVTAEGLGSAQRFDAPEGWAVESNWDAGRWTVSFLLKSWPALEAFDQLAIAVWRGETGDRGGLKSISPGWFPAS